jgi:hypothetical protein
MKIDLKKVGAIIRPSTPSRQNELVSCTLHHLPARIYGIFGGKKKSFFVPTEPLNAP